MKDPFVGAVVVYRPNPKLPEFHDKGHGIELPAIVVKVWMDGLVNLRVVDLNVFLDSANNPPWIFGAKYSKERQLDTWKWPDE